MMKSVQKHKGFYIGRYEAGTLTARTSITVGTTTPVVVKKDAYPYNYVKWGIAMNNYTDEYKDLTASSPYDFGHGAVYLSKNMYDPTQYGVVSTLCYGVQWDTMLDFIKDDNHNVNNSISWGNYYDNTGTTWEITRQTAEYFYNGWHSISDEPTHKKEKESSKSILLTTGANENFKAKNIYDVAGNVYEWTMEACSSSWRVFRGGHYSDYRGGHPASSRDWLMPTLFEIGFRPALYIK